MSFPARGDEMVNQEVEALSEAAEESRLPAWTRALTLAPVAAIGGGAVLRATGRRTAGAVALGLGLAALTLGGLSRFMLRRRMQDRAIEEEMRLLADERAAIETGNV